MIKKGIFVIFFLFLFSFFLSCPLSVSAQKKATESAEATQAAEATPSAIEKVKEAVEKEKKDDITESTPEIKGKLESYLADNPVKPLKITNFLQHAIREMVKRGVPANTIVLILLFPLTAVIIAASRHIVGIRGFGIFLPTVLSVVFVSTGTIEGLLVFFIILTVATTARMLLRKMKMQYLPRMALLLWFVSLGVLGLLFIAPFLKLTSIMALSIFPILILILLAENFISTQIGMSMKQAVKMTLVTLVIALVCSFVLQLDSLQKFVLLNPEIVVFITAALNVFMGKYTGLRWLEYRKFRELLK